MDEDDFMPRRRANDILHLLAHQDLDLLSVDELVDRERDLLAEVDRTRNKFAKALNHKAKAEMLFKR